jgi:hypothetical protein
MTVMDAKKMDAPDKTRAAVNDLARMAMVEVLPRRHFVGDDLGSATLTGKTVSIAKAIARYNAGALGAMRDARMGAVLGKTGVGKTSAQVHRALALYTLGQLEPTGKTRVADGAAAPTVRPRRKASPKAVALLERFKDVPSVDPHRFREDMDRVLDPGL